MFITLQAKDRDGVAKPTKINTSQIAFIVEDYVHMANTAILQLDKKELKMLEDELYGPATVEANPAAAEKTATLLNELHSLCGGRGEAKPTSDRKARLKTRMKDFTEDELKTAARHLGEDEFMQGANDSGKRYGTLDYLLRTSANVNKYLDLPDKKPKPMF
jgi:hypothetical protein